MTESSVRRACDQLVERGYCVIDGIGADAVTAARQSITDHAGLLKNTRPNPSAGHLAGFHRYPEIEHLHSLVSNHPVANRILEQALGSRVRSIGLSDITVNRSQPWHVDLLRGRYRAHLTPEICWGPDGGGVFKSLLYLQRGATLRVIPGAHNLPRPLDDDRKSEPESEDEVEAIEVAPGSIVLMDIRLPHRGSSEQELSDPANFQHPKMLISTVLTGTETPLGVAMERGNLERLLDWDACHRSRPEPQLQPRSEVAEAGSTAH